MSFIGLVQDDSWYLVEAIASISIRDKIVVHLHMRIGCIGICEECCSVSPPAQQVFVT